MSATACAGCGAAIDASTSTYSEDGRLICAQCEAKQTIKTGEGRASDAIFGAGVSSAMFGVTSLGCNPAMLMSFAAIGAGSSALFAMMRHPEYRTTLGDTKWAVAAFASIVGVLLGLVRPGLFVLAIVFGIAGALD